MSDRLFGQITFQEGGCPVTARPIVCSACGERELFRLTSSQSRSVRMAANFFERRGWVVGSKASKDLCPACRAAKRLDYHERRERRAATEIGEALTMTTQSNRTTPSAAEPPPSPTRDHKRCIHLKLSEVYLEKDGRYDRGWSDHRVAMDLGVPRAWVTHERKEYFGDGEGGEEVSALISKVDALRVDLDKAVERATALASAYDGIQARLVEVEREAKPLRSLVPA